MVNVQRGLLEVKEALWLYRDALPPGLRSRAGFYAGIARGTIATVKNGRRRYVVRRRLEALLNGEVEPKG